MGNHNWLSTSGRSWAELKHDKKLSESKETSTTLRGEGAVKLMRTSKPEATALPERLSLGGGWPIMATLGRNAANAAVVHVKAVSKIHCQLALRIFKLPNDGEVHEALFLRDVSKNKTLVNGAPAFRPWHWLQEGDIVGLHPDPDEPNRVLNLYKVCYCTLRKLPGSIVMAEDLSAAQAAVRQNGKTADASVACRSNRGGARPGAGRPPARMSASAASAAGRGGSAAASAVPAAVLPPTRREVVRFSGEICGSIIDVTYTDPPATYRMRVTGFEIATGYHQCDSRGLSLWDGESFTDVIDLNMMYAAGYVRFKTEVLKSRSEPEGGPPAKRRAR